MTDSLILQQPPVSEQLLLLFHGVGGEPRHMQALGDYLKQAFKQACVVAVAAPLSSGAGSGRQWFSVEGIDEARRPQRVQDALPGFIASVEHWQRHSGVGADGTALIGFSQGAIMVMEAALAKPQLASRIVAIAGRYARLPEQAHLDYSLHLLHGQDDRVISRLHSVQAQERWQRLGGDVSLDILPDTGHEISASIAQALLQRLSRHVPLRYFQEAAQAAPLSPQQEHKLH